MGTDTNYQDDCERMVSALVAEEMEQVYDNWPAISDASFTSRLLMRGCSTKVEGKKGRKREREGPMCNGRRHRATRNASALL